MTEITDEEVRSFYKSPEWRRLRFEFLINSNRKCACCGAGPEQTRIVVDHIHPIKKEWEMRLEKANLQILCNDCNLGKGSTWVADFLSRKVRRIRGPKKGIRIPVEPSFEKMINDDENFPPWEDR